VRAVDTLLVPATLPVRATVYAARGDALHVPESATAIATGAPLPSGADAVIPLEDVEVLAGAIRIRRSVGAGERIFPPGDDARRGDTLAERGLRIGPATLGILAASGIVRIPVIRRPRVAVLTGGDEVVPPAATPERGQIRNSNAPVIAATLRELGADVAPSVHMRDDRTAVRAALEAALASSDLVVTTGGASVGERDFVKAVAEELGVTFAFRSVAMRPSKPSAFGTRDAARLAVLPGNPAAAFVALHTLVRPAVLRLSGAAEPDLPRIAVRLDGRIRAKPGRDFFAFAALSARPDGLWAEPLENQCSSLTRTMSDAAGFIVVPPGTQTYVTGDTVAFDVVDWSRVRSITPALTPR
jgi:molybdopterin molybdotransferase